MTLKYLLMLLLIGVVALATPSLADFKKPLVTVSKVPHVEKPIKNPLPPPKFPAPLHPGPPITSSKPPHKEQPVPPLQPPKKRKPPVVTSIEKPPVYEPPKTEKPPVYKPPRIEKPPVYKPPEVEKPPYYKTPSPIHHN